MRIKLGRASMIIVATTALLAGCSTGSTNGTAESGAGGDTDAGPVATDEDGDEGGKPLIAAMELAYPPFETKDAAGNPEGVSVDFVTDFAAAYGYDLTIENTSFDGLIPMLQTGKADLVMSSMTITEDRKQSVDFSDPYARAQLAILANADSGIGTTDARHIFNVRRNPSTSRTWYSDTNEKSRRTPAL